MRIVEFFEDGTGALSMTRLLCFISFPPATYVLIKNPSPEMLWPYVSAFVMGYVGGKISDAMGKPKAGSMNVENVESVSVNQPIKAKKK